MRDHSNESRIEQYQLFWPYLKKKNCPGKIRYKNVLSPSVLSNMKTSHSLWDYTPFDRQKKTIFGQNQQVLFSCCKSGVPKDPGTASGWTMLDLRD